MELTSPGDQTGMALPATAPDARPAMPFRLMDLPTEVRLFIYAELLVVGKVFYTPTAYELRTSGRFEDYTSYRKPELQILRVSKQVHDEAEELYLSKNLFVLPHLCHRQHPLSTREVEDDREHINSKRSLFSTIAMQDLRHISIALDLECGESLATGGDFWVRFEEQHPNMKFDNMTFAERLQISHNVSKASQSVYHNWMWQAVAECSGLHSLELDVTNAYCPADCCRNMNFFVNHLTSLGLKTLRVIGIRHQTEMEEWQER